MPDPLRKFMVADETQSSGKERPIDTAILFGAVGGPYLELTNKQQPVGVRETRVAARTRTSRPITWLVWRLAVSSFSDRR
jgi:hypothetical protein